MGFGTLCKVSVLCAAGGLTVDLPYGCLSC
jgi:hypothetical protein